MEFSGAQLLPAKYKDPLSPRYRRLSEAINDVDDDDGEKIVVHPSTELIADEYEHEDNQKGLVIIFHAKYKHETQNTDTLIVALEKHGYEIDQDKHVYLISTKKFVLDTLREISKEENSHKTCLILIFMGRYYVDDKFVPDEEEEDPKHCISTQDVWKNFTAENCPSFRNKPKVFIFLGTKIGGDINETDGTPFAAIAPAGAYDIPAEADILIIYKTVQAKVKNTGKQKFLSEICKNFNLYGEREDLVSLVTHTDHQNEKRPLIISTLTRKFYIRPSNIRGNNFDIYNYHGNIVDDLKDLHEKVAYIQRRAVEGNPKSNQITSIDGCLPTTNKLFLEVHVNHKKSSLSSGGSSSGKTTVNEDAAERKPTKKQKPVWRP